MVTLSGRAYYWFQTIRHTITNTNDLQITFLKKFNKWGNTERDLNCAWNKLTFNSDQYTVQEFAQELDLLAALIGAANAQIIDKFKECFPPEIESQLLDINNLDWLVTKANQLVQLFKPKQTASSSLLLHSAQQQLTQNEPLAIKFSTEHKVPIGSKWANNNNQQRNRGQYQNTHIPRNIGQFNNQIQNRTQFQYSNRTNCSLNQGNSNGQYRSNNIYTPQRGCCMNSRMHRGTYSNVNDHRHPYRGSYQYRYPQYRSRNMTQFQGSMYRQGPNRGQQIL